MQLCNLRAVDGDDVDVVVDDDDDDDDDVVVVLVIVPSCRC